MSASIKTSSRKKIPRRKMQVSNGHYLNFDHIARLIYSISSIKELSKTKMADLEEETGLPLRQVRNRISVGRALGLFKQNSLQLTTLGKLVSTEGLIRQASDIRPKVIIATFECPGCGAQILVDQRGRKFKEPTKCQCGRRGKFKMLDKRMVDVQRLVIEETPESLEGGEQPKRINVFLEEDLLTPKLEKRRYPGNKTR